MIKSAQGAVQKTWLSLARIAAQQPTQYVQPWWNRVPEIVEGTQSTAHCIDAVQAVGGFAPLLQGRSLSTSSSQVRPASPEDDTSAQAQALAGQLFWSSSQERGALTPVAIVDYLDRFIVGQHDAKRAVAVALRNRWRRSQLPKGPADEVMPKNILMIGPTGCGKTEIARRLAKLTHAPFIKVEATKYTELGYIGRDVEDIIKDLVENAHSLVRERLRERVVALTAGKAENQILESLIGEHVNKETKDSFRELYQAGELDDRTVELDLPSDSPKNKMNLDTGIIMIDNLLDKKSTGKRTQRKKMKVAEARARIEELEADKHMSSDMVTKEALRATEQDGIVFIDEIDKIVGGGSRQVGSSVSSEGVQRDLLPIIEGSTVQTKHGNVNTDHILFVCSGAFHSVKPADMLAELQGRLPIRVELKGLVAEDFYRILTEPDNNMVMQHQALLETEGVMLRFTDSALHTVARVAEEANRLMDNIGARRLHTVLERLLADVSYNAPELVEEAQRNGQSTYEYVVDDQFVLQIMFGLLQKQDLSRYVI
ncbi:P-loop containing nucleoside triphosphate hydrolase protein [Dunaliella salina]|uniref:P-loop containing nucleoside triphosphate hydrolase protein n=1 Tax=Dunaliella salina TaxID=3046 RepID=A0ABQ7G296_DUNSA|nr:P-loop containing nucleoside triphosphate hydrolase protein [Dunaliella salina]|eukprot:KAF5828727.1 P-loop containing nucleoside triphosphate hydrolase protein [Dunaliella salina]